METEINYNRLLGEFMGTLKGICIWEIPNELKIKLEKQIEELEHKTAKGAKGEAV